MQLLLLPETSWLGIDAPETAPALEVMRLGHL
jgi:hypothetical protein